MDYDGNISFLYGLSAAVHNLLFGVEAYRSSLVDGKGRSLSPDCTLFREVQLQAYSRCLLKRTLNVDLRRLRQRHTADNTLRCLRIRPFSFTFNKIICTIVFKYHFLHHFTKVVDRGCLFFLSKHGHSFRQTTMDEDAMAQ